jgi:geranylgeranyl reductase family protein
VTDSYDALVVGGGPGGASTAYHLATGGARVLLVEKAAFPREKTCGDGLTPRGTAALDAMGLTEAYADWPRNVGLRCHGGGRSLELPWPEVTGEPSFGLTQPRIDLDHLLIRQAEKAGAIVMTETDVLGPRIDDGVVVGAELQREGEDPFDVRASYVIAADGASSRIGQALGHTRDPRRPVAVAIRGYYRTERDEDPWLDSYLELWKGDEQLGGYGWVFPIGDGTVNVGLGVLNITGSINYKQMLADWAPTAGQDWGFTGDDLVAKPRSNPLPMGANRHPPLYRGVLFVGDAAGMINPFNGEGISYAMETGQMAAETVLSAMQTGDRSRLAKYPAALTERYGSYYTLGRIFVKLIGDPRVMKFCTTFGMPRPRVMKLVLKLLGNMYEPVGGTTSDRVVQALTAMAPAR